MSYVEVDPPKKMVVEKAEVERLEAVEGAALGVLENTSETPYPDWVRVKSSALDGLRGALERERK